MKQIILLFLITLSFATNIKKELKETKKSVSMMNQKLDLLAKQIQENQNNLKNIDKKEAVLNAQIKALSKELQISNHLLKNLSKTEEKLNKQKEKINQDIIKFLSQNYYIDSQEISTPQDLINLEIIKAALKKASKKIREKIKSQKQLNREIELINNQIKSIITKQKILQQKKASLKKLKAQKVKTIATLSKQMKYYKQKLLETIKKQKILQKKLAELRIIKRQPKINVSKVRKVGSAYFRPKIASYRGRKTIAPVQGKVVKKFGSYIDPIYKIKIYNDTITIKPFRQNSVVRTIFDGKVVYVDREKGIIAIKHKNNLFSIYANLTKISPILRKGSYVRKGQIIARTNALEFEITYKDNPINPLKVIKF